MTANSLPAAAVPEVSTAPGSSVTAMKPSSFSFRANFVVAIVAAAFDIPYATVCPEPKPRVALRSPAAEPMTTIVFLSDARRRGRNAVIAWMGPRLFTLNYRRENVWCEV